MRWTQLAVAALSAGLFVGGCVSSSGEDASGLAAGLNITRKVDPSTAEYRVVPEIVPESRLVKEDTTPKWDHGRYGWMPGRELMLVLTRVTSMETFAEPISGQRTPQRGPREDRIIERMWISLPGDLQIGEVLRLQDIETKRRLGYDRGDAGGEMFADPYRTLGTITLREVTAEHIVMDVDVRVRPQRHRDWDVSGTYTLPLKAVRKYATAADTTRVPWVVRDASPDISSIFNTPRLLGEAPELEPIAPVTPAPGTASSTESSPRPVPGSATPTTKPSTPASPAPGTTSSSRPANSTGATTGGTNPPRETAAAFDVAGRWAAKTPRWDLQMQFSPDGKFAYSSTRLGGNYQPGIKRGTWKLTDAKLVMKVESFEFDGVDHMRFLGVADPQIVLNAALVEGKLRLKGDYLDREGEMDVVFDAADFGSMIATPR